MGEGNEEAQGHEGRGGTHEGHEAPQGDEGHEEGHEGHESNEGHEGHEEGHEGDESHEGHEGDEEVSASILCNGYWGLLYGARRVVGVPSSRRAGGFAALRCGKPK